MAFATASISANSPVRPVEFEELDICPSCLQTPDTCNQLAADGIAVCPEADVLPVREDDGERDVWDEYFDRADDAMNRDEVMS